MIDVSATLAPRRGLTPMFGIVLFGFLSVALPLPALSIFVHETLGFGALTVGLAIGLQSVATVLTRHAAGTLCDRSGARRAVLLGLPLASVAGLIYVAAALLPTGPGLRLAVLLAGRVVLGLAESLFITATMSWGIGRIGPARTGTVMAWQGIALYVALGLGAPAGLWLQAAFGFAGVAAVASACPLVALAIAAALPPVPAAGGQRVPLYRVLGLIWRPGLVLTLATVPFAALASFLALLFAHRDWPGAGLALTLFAAGYIGVRLIGAHWPDRFGGRRTATVSLLVECAGQAVLFAATTPAAAAAGALLTGIGFSLVFPAMGVEATRSVPPAQRGRAVGNFIAFFDVSLAATGPAVGWAIGRAGDAAAYAVGGAACVLALMLLQAARRR